MIFEFNLKKKKRIVKQQQMMFEVTNVLMHTSENEILTLQWRGRFSVNNLNFDFSSLINK